MSRAPLVLAIEPDLRQAAIVKRVVRERVLADIVVVDSRDAAIAAIRTAIPDVLLASALLSPRDEDDLIAHLRTLEGASHLQTHTIPQLASALGPGEGGRGGLLSAFRRKKPSGSTPAGCDPDLFAEEIREFLQRAADRKREAAETGTVPPLPVPAARAAETPVAAPAEELGGSSESSWASPFEWRPSTERRTVPPQPEPPPPDPVFADSDFRIPDPASADPGSLIADPSAVDPGSLIADPSAVDPGALVADPGPLIPDLESPIPDPALTTASPRVHTPAPFSVWAKKEAPKPVAVADAVDGGFEGLFAEAIPADVASVAYATGVRIRRVRVRAAKDAHPSLHGAMVLGRRMIAELSGSDASA